MALHKREQIMAAITTTLTGLDTTGSNATRGRVYSVDEDNLPHLSLYQGADNIVSPDGEDEATNIYVMSSFPLVIEVVNEASSGILETEINQICKEIIIALMDDTTQGSLALNTIEISTSEPILSGNREKRTGMVVMEFEILYRRLREDPSQ